MSFFELDGGAKKAPAKNPSAKKAPAKKAPAKKAPAKKGSKKGGNFLGTVSELFAPAGWENFVTAAGLLALDRTDNYLRKNKDSKKQRGGADDEITPSKADYTPTTEEMESFTSRMSGGARKKKSSSYRKHHGGEDAMIAAEEEMMGGTRKKNSSRKQRGGSDGHHTVEDLDAMMGSEANEEMSSQTGGAKNGSKSKSRTRSRSSSSSKSKPKVKKTVRKVRKQKGGSLIEIMTKPNLDNLYNEYISRITNHSQKISSMSEPQESLNRIEIYRDILRNMNITITDDLLRDIDEYVMLRSAVNSFEKKNLEKLKPNEIKRYNNVKTRLDNIHKGTSASIGNASNLQTGNTASIENAANLQTGVMSSTLFNDNTPQPVENAQQVNTQPVNTEFVANKTASSFGFGGKPKSNSSSKKPKAKNPKTKAPKKK